LEKAEKRMTKNKRGTNINVNARETKDFLLLTTMLGSIEKLTLSMANFLTRLKSGDY
jgi:hypothetical protein